MAKRPNIQVTSTTPAAVSFLSKTIRVDATAADAVGFEAFWLPKGAVPLGAFTYNAATNATQTISVGITLGGGQLMAATPTVAIGFAPVGITAGTYMGTPLAADTLFYAKASVTLSSPVMIRVDYYIPAQGFDH